MLIYSEMSPHRATNPLGLLTGPSERQMALLFWKERKQQRIKRGEEGRERKGSVFQEVLKRRGLRRQMRGGRLQVGVRGEVERQQERRGDREAGRS